MIQIIQAISQPHEDADLWSYPVSELDYLLAEADEGTTYALWQDRLYEIED